MKNDYSLDVLVGKGDMNSHSIFKVIVIKLSNFSFIKETFRIK